MLKNVRKSKILLSLFAICLVMVLFGNLYSLATEDNTAGNNPVTITPTTNENVGQGANNTNTGNNTANKASIVATSGNNTANNSSISNNTNNTANNNTSVYNTNNTSNSSHLPYTGTNSKAMLLIVVFALSAVYAYKKVSDYNV